jgi:threonyl-tRNA synthetase
MSKALENKLNKKGSKEQELWALRHTAEHVLHTAMQNLYPKLKKAMGPATEDGFYNDFDLEEKITDADFPKIEKEMRRLIDADFPMIQEYISADKAREIFKDNPYKLEWIEDIGKRGEELSTYRMGNEEVDLCSGPHVASTGKIKAFKLLSIAGAYWHGDEKNKMLTRIYGTAFPTQKELDEYLKQLEEAKKRDHRKLGQTLDLYHIDEKVGLGLPLWHPKGAILWRIIEDFWYKKHLKNGYELVRSPHIGDSNLWKTSGHLDFYSSGMYPPLEAGQALEEKQKGEKVKASEEYYLKPMNCPFHLQIYNSTPKSYRDLPVRWAECGTVYRFEKKGELSGLIRVRGFTQDDAHIICRKDQVEYELEKVIDFILFIYKSFGFETDSVHVYLSLRDPENKEKYAGDDVGWDFTEDILRKVAKKCKLNFTEEKGEAAFYGPKLDFKLKDAIGRLWQCSTLQFDFNLPQRFEVSYTNEKGEKETPYMLHRALFGSYERFIGLLIEHYAGSFPTWISPTQVKILPIAERHIGYANEVQKKLDDKNIRTELDERSETLQAKIRDAQIEKIPYMLILGDKEIKEQKVAVRLRSGEDLGQMSYEEFLIRIKEKIDNKSLDL